MREHDAVALRGGRVDVHTHFFPPGLPDFATQTGDARWPALVVEDGRGRIVRGGETFRVVPAACWDLERRLEAMDGVAIDVHVLSPVPVTLTYWADVKLAVAFSRRQNDLLAAATASHPDRFRGFASVPLPDVD